jgi:hypothetical protein
MRHGFATARDGLRWHLIEAEPHRYDWSSWLPMLEAAGRAGMQVIWDLWHYGTPDHLDIWSPDFVDRLTAFAEAAARLHARISGAPPLWCPLNELSFFSFIAGEVGDFHPYALGRGLELKRQLVRAAAAAARMLRAVDPRCRLLWAEPIIHIVPRTGEATEIAEAEAYRLAQFQALDMISGRIEPELGGRPELLDIVGCNFYPHNQWFNDGGTIPLGHHHFRPLSAMLGELHGRYGRPIVLSETGAEGSGRAPWFHYVCQEVADAIASGIPVGGVCLYPVLCYPGWDDDRTCQTGLFGPPAEDGGREIYAPLFDEMQRQSSRFGGNSRTNSLRGAGSLSITPG